MKQSEIRLHIELDEENLPEKIFWSATDGPGGLQETKSFNLSLWDHLRKETLRIDLWAKDMPVEEMKRFVIDSIGGMAQTIRSATDDQVMANEMEKLCDTLIKHIREQTSQNE